MTAKVKLGTAIIPDDHRVFKFFPGKSYKFYDLADSAKLAFLDVRGLERLGDDYSRWTDAQLLKVISEDRVARNVAKGQSPPTKIRVSQGDKAALTFLRGLLFKAKKGDLLAVPNRGWTTNVLIGQLLDEPGTLKTVRAVDDKMHNTYFGRRVRWIGRIEKRKLSQSVIDLLHTQAAFFDIGRSNYENIYQAAFDSFVYDGQYVGSFRTTKNVFTSKDNFLTSVWFELLEVVNEAAQDNTKLKPKNIYDIVINSKIPDDDRDGLSINVQSPGLFRLRSLVSTPLVTMALFSMAASGVSHAEALKASVTANILGDASSECLAEVDESVREYLEILGKERWEQACVVAVQAEKEATLKADAVTNK